MDPFEPAHFLNTCPTHVPACVQEWNIIQALAGDGLPDAPISNSSSASPTASSLLKSFRLDEHAIAEIALGFPAPTHAEQAAWNLAVEDMWQAAEVGYPQHLLVLLERHHMPADYLPPGGINTLLMAAVNVHTWSQQRDHDLSKVVWLLLSRGAHVCQAQRESRTTPLHALTEQPEPFYIRARLEVLLGHITSTPAAAGALEARDAKDKRPEDVAASPILRESLKRLRLMIDLNARG